MSEVRKVLKEIKKNEKARKDTDFMTSDVKELKEQLDYFLFHKDSSILISLQGYWGIGKTYFWHEYIKSKGQDVKVAYISLFGAGSLDDIKREILLQVSSLSKIINKIKHKLGNSRIYGVDIASFISVLEKKDFKNIIVCFDDFERISPNLSISEVLGFISELKERYECKIVMINNNDVLKEQDLLEHKKLIKRSQNDIAIEEILSDLDQKELENIIYGYEKHKINKKRKNGGRIEKYIITQNNNFEILEQFSEKIIDITLRYEPSIGDLVELIKDENKDYIDYDFIKELFYQLDNDNKRFNLRLMKQLCLKLELVEDILKSEEVLDELKRGLIFDIFRVVVKENIKNQGFFKPIQTISYQIKDELLNIMLRHKLKNSEKILSYLKERSQVILENKKNEEFKSEVEDLYYRYLYDLKYSDKYFSKDLFDLLQTNDKNIDITKVIGLQQISFYITILIKIDPNNKEKYQGFFLEKSKEHIKSNIKSIEQLKELLQYDFMKILDDEKLSELEVYYNELNEKASEVNCDKIIELIKSIFEKSGYNRRDEERLNGIQKYKIKKCLIEDREFFEIIEFFIKWLQGFSGNKPFELFYKNVIEIYEELRKEEKYKNKIEFVLQRLNINNTNT